MPKKTCFFGCSDITPGKRFANLMYGCDWAQTYRVAVELTLKGATIIKLVFLRGKNTFSAKKFQNFGFTGFFRSALKRFEFSLYNTYDAQTHSIDAQLDGQDVETIKTTILWRKNCVLSWKTSEKLAFWDTRHYSTKKFGLYKNPN